MNLKKAIVLFLILCMAFSVFSGCGAKDESTDSKEVDAGKSEASEAEQATGQAKNINLTFWAGPDWIGIYSPEEENAKNGDFWNFVGSEFNKKNPNVKVNVEIIPFANSNEKVNVALASNTPPDIWFYSTFNQYDLMSRGAVVPLDDMITEEDKKNISEDLWENVKYNGKVYGWPFMWCPQMLIVNVDLFEKMNATSFLPQNEDRTWTMDELKAALKAVTNNGKETDHYGLGLFAKDMQADTWNFMYLWAFGAKTFNDDYSQIALNSPEGVEALTFLKSLVDEGLTAPGPESLDAGDAINLFVQGKLAVGLAIPKYTTFIDQAAREGTLSKRFKHMFVMVPGDNPSYPPMVWASVVFDTKDADRIKYSKEFVKFASSEPYIKAAKASLSMPAITALTDQLYEGNEDFKYFKQISKYATGSLHAEVQGYTEIRNKFYPELQAVFANKKTPQQALDDFAKAGNEILAKYK